jgi:hypothetical protein
MDFTFLGRNISCVDIGQATRGWITENWLTSVANTPHGGTTPRPSEFSITISAREEPTPRHIRDDDAVTSDLGTKHILRGNDEFWILENRDRNASAVHARLEDGSATLELHGAPFTGWMALLSAFSEAMASSGILRLHAAAIHHDGRTIALLGPSGRGKSTTVLRAILGGWHPIAEDGCWLDVETLNLMPADGHLRLRPDGVELLRAVRPDLAPGSLEQRKYEIPLEKLGERRVASTLTDLVCLERSETSQPEWRPLPPARTVMALHESAGVPHTARVGILHAKAFGYIVRRTHNSTLRMGALSSPFPTAPPANRAEPRTANWTTRYVES